MKLQESDVIRENSAKFTSEESPTCGVIVGRFHGQFLDILAAISNLKQTITYLHLPSWAIIGVDDVKCPVLGLDPAARCVQIGRSLPSSGSGGGARGPWPPFRPR